jgi:hypothetical protein
MKKTHQTQTCFLQRPNDVKSSWKKTHVLIRPSQPATPDELKSTTGEVQKAEVIPAEVIPAESKVHCAEESILKAPISSEQNRKLHALGEERTISADSQVQSAEESILKEPMSSEKKLHPHALEKERIIPADIKVHYDEESILKAPISSKQKRQPHALAKEGKRLFSLISADCDTSAKKPNDLKTNSLQCQEFLEEDRLSFSSILGISDPLAKTQQQAPSFRFISIKRALFLLLTSTFLLRVVSATDCEVMNTWLSKMFNATGTECCSQSGISCVDDRITVM